MKNRGHQNSPDCSGYGIFAAVDFEAFANAI